MSAAIASGIRQIEIPWVSRSGPITVGKDILELLSSSMYVEPMTIYREYVQNSADAIDAARRCGVLPANTPGRVDISIDALARTVRIRDNGTGVEEPHFSDRLTAFGASAKRSTRARGFRGVGRLAGIGYCQELVFRSRSTGATRVSELRWDCKKTKAILRDATFQGDLADLVAETVSIRHTDAAACPDHFFEVELRNIIRHRNDQLLSGRAVEDYLSQVAPVPFSPSFAYGEQIAAVLERHVAPGNIEIRVSPSASPVCRPHRNRFHISEGVEDEFRDLQILEIPSVDGSPAGIGWVLHHGYKGALPPSALIRGLRVRSGNIQVGGHDLLQEIFPESRFNSWSVGELHILDPRIVPNGRRDHFEQNVHLDNVLNQLSPIARDIAWRCRTNSLVRHWIREFERSAESAKEKLAIIKQGGVGVGRQSDALQEAGRILVKMERISSREAIAPKIRKKQNVMIGQIRRRLDRLRKNLPKARALSRMSPKERSLLERVFGLVYECSSNQGAARILVDRILKEMS
jgi:hypothetical protein